MIERVLKAFVCLAGIFLLVTLGLLALQARSTLRQADALVTEAHVRLNGTFQNANAILIQAGLAANQARLVSIEQRTQLQLISARTLTLMDHADGLLVNSTLAVDKFSRDTDASLQELPQVVRDLDASIKTLNEAAADPNIKKTLANVAATTEHTEKTMAHVEEVSGEVETKVHQMMKPVSLLKRAAIGVWHSFLLWIK